MYDCDVFVCVYTYAYMYIGWAIAFFILGFVGLGGKRREWARSAQMHLIYIFV